jgi:SAM-dependent methyltransferase
MNPREYEIMFAHEEAYWWYRGMRRITRAFAPDLFSQSPLSWALDAGCGTGRNLEELESGQGLAVGIDASLRALSFARRRGRSRLVCGSVEALPFRSLTFAGVLCRDVLYMVPDEGRAVREIARLLAPGGRLVLSSPAFAALSGAHDRAVGGLRRHTAPGLAALLHEAGLRVARTTYANFFLAGPIWVLRKVTGTLSRRRPREEVLSDFSLAPAPFEEILFSFLSLEAQIIARARLPFGVTVFIAAAKPVQGTSVTGK